MFGVRTIVLGLDLLTLRADDASAYAGWRGELPAKAAKLTTAISVVNTALAVVSLATFLRSGKDSA